MNTFFEKQKEYSKTQRNPNIFLNDSKTQIYQPSHSLNSKTLNKNESAVSEYELDINLDSV